MGDINLCGRESLLELDGAANAGIHSGASEESAGAAWRVTDAAEHAALPMDSANDEGAAASRTAYSEGGALLSSSKPSEESRDRPPVEGCKDCPAPIDDTGATEAAVP